jgi:two-component system, LytTR family, sensor kinase
MFRTSTFAYWCCQVAGWTLTWGVYALNGFYYHQPHRIFTISCVSGFLATHLLRTFLRQYARPILPFPKESIRLLLAIFFTTGLATAFKSLGIYFFEPYHGPLTATKLFLLFPTDYLVLIVPWTLVYWGFRFALRSKAQALERQRLEWRMEEMKIRAGETGITLEGLMDKMGDILPLIEEDPARARNEITAFSRLLREAYLAASPK